MPWHKQPAPKPSVKNERAKILWDIPIYLDVAPENGANKPNIVILDKDKATWIIIVVKQLFAIQAVSMKEHYINNRNIQTKYQA